MDFSLSSDQLALQNVITDWSAAHRDTHALREQHGTAVSRDDAWSELAGMGLAGLLVDEKLGGSSGSLLDACIVAEALAENLIPVPFVGSSVLAVSALQLFDPDDDTDKVLGEIARGSRLVSMAFDQDLAWPPTGGTAVAWDWLPGADIAWPHQGMLMRSADVQVGKLLDRDLTRACVEIDLPGAPSGDAASSETCQQFIAVGRTISAASLVGTMSGALKLAVEHAKSRQQFGQAIGTFQAVQHMCSDMLVDVESSRTAMYGAAWAVENLAPHEAHRAASIAQMWASAAARRVSESAMQIHGGMGFTWECDVHLYIRSALLCGELFGGATRQLDAVAEHLFDGETSGTRLT